MIFFRENNLPNLSMFQLLFIFFQGSLDCGMQIMKNEGFMSLMKGAGANVLDERVSPLRSLCRLPAWPPGATARGWVLNTRNPASRCH